MSRATDIIETLTYDQWNLESKEINKAVDKASDALNGAFDSRAGGGLSDEDRATPRYKKLKKMYDIAFKNLQTFNKIAPKSFQKKQRMEKRKHWKN